MRLASPADTIQSAAGVSGDLANQYVYAGTKDVAQDEEVEQRSGKDSPESWGGRSRWRLSLE